MYYEGLIPTDIVRYKKHKLINISDKAEAKLASSFDYMHNEQVSPEYATLYYNRLKTSFASDSANDTVVFTPYSTFNVSNSLTREAAEQTAWYIHHSGKTRMNNAYKTKEGIQTLNANLVILNPTQRTIDFAAGVSPMLVRQVVEQLTKYDDIEYYHVLYDGADIGTVGNVNSNSVFDDNSTFSKIYKYANSPANVNVLLTYSDIQSAKKPKNITDEQLSIFDNVEQPKMSRYVSDTEARGTLLENFIRRGKQIQMDPRLQEMLKSVPSKDVGLVDDGLLRYINGDEKATLNIPNLYKYIRTTPTMNKYTWDLINKYFFKNENIHSFEELTQLADIAGPEMYALAPAIKASEIIDDKWLKAKLTPKKVAALVKQITTDENLKTENKFMIVYLIDTLLIEVTKLT